MKKIIIASLIVFGGIFTQDAAAQTKTGSQDKEYNIFYAQDIPYVESQESNQKMQRLEKMFKDYAAAANKNDVKTAQTLKEIILTWRSENQEWISKLETNQATYIDNWLKRAFTTLRLYDNK